MNVRELILFAVGAVLLAGAAWLALDAVPLPGAASHNARAEVEAMSSTDVDQFHDEFFKALIARSPEWTSDLRLFDEDSDPTGGQLNDISIARQKEDLAFVKAGLAKLRGFDRDTQSEEQRLASDILGWFLDDDVRGEDFQFHEYLVHQLFGVQNNLFQFMLDTHSVFNRRDAENYISRLNDVSRQFDELIAVLAFQERQGIIAPKFILERVLQGLGGAGDPTQSAFYGSFLGKLDGVPELSEADKATLATEAAEAILTSVQPAYAKLRDALEYQLTLASNDAGVWKLPNGDAYYRQMLRHHTTTDLTPEAIHQIGLFEVERIQEELRQIFVALGVEGADAPAFGDAMRAYWGLYRGAPELNYPRTDEGRKQALVDYAEIVNEAEEKIDHLFDVLPSAPVQMERVPTSQEGSAPGAYYIQPSLDGTRPGVFYVNLLTTPFKPKMRTLTYHEAIPGHHFHLALQQESDLPLLQNVLVFTAHVEGWALYAEKLMREEGMYPDEHTLIENLWHELFRAGRLVVDTGIHYKRWTRQQALDYYYDTLGTPIPNEIDRYIVWPGQATAYKIGELKILELRQRAMDELGDTFDIKDFHNVILQHGNMPLNILEEQVLLYIEEATGV